MQHLGATTGTTVFEPEENFLDEPQDHRAASPATEYIPSLPPSPRPPADVPFGVYLPMPGPQMRSRSPSLPVAGPSGLPRHDSNKENMFPLKNPLANVFGTKGVAKKVPLAPTQSTAQPVNEIVGNPGPPQPPGIVPQKVEAKKVKMRPGPVKNARNLCAIRWIKQVNTNGTSEQFRAYWDGLTAEQREQYRLEAEQFQQKGQWQKASDAAVCNGTVF